jgi:biotin carboxyl carrier protein
MFFLVGAVACATGNDQLVEAGPSVTADAPLVLHEAMKMEHTVRAADAGVVRTLRVAVGDQVGADRMLEVVA